MPASSATIYAFDPDTSSFWPMSLPDENYDPFSIVQYEPLGDSDESDVILGCRDSYPRQLDRVEFDDDGTAFTAYVVVGPIRLGSTREGLIQQVDGILTDASGDITWELYVGNTSEDAADTSGTAKATGTWVAGLNTTARPRVKGVGYSLKLISAETDDGWNIEGVDVVSIIKGDKRT